LIYETKGLTLEEVDELYNEIDSARKSVGWKPTITWTEKKEMINIAGAKGPVDEHREFQEQAPAHV
jgi:hypothetical protein